MFTINPDYALELSIILRMLVSWVFVTHSKVNPKVKKKGGDIAIKLSILEQRL